LSILIDVNYRLGLFYSTNIYLDEVRKQRRCLHLIRWSFYNFLITV